MAKNFGKSGMAKRIKEVEKLSAEKAQVITLQMINTNNLVDHPENGEDIEYTQDIELSIKELGFTDPIEVTNFGMEDGKYMIISGHRRRAAGVKTGMEVFPCLVRSFKNEDEMKNYLLLSNSQRNSARDPLLLVKRYLMHETYLKKINFKGSIREEVANRLGISVQQADRYKQFNKIILPVWDMVRNEEIGMSSVLPMASHTPEEQAEIYDIIVECVHSMDDDEKPNRKTVKMIIDKYREGKRSWQEIVEENQKKEFIVNNITHGEETKQEENNHFEDPVEGQTTIDDFTGPQSYEDEVANESTYEPSPYEVESVPAFDMSSSHEKDYEVEDLKKDITKNFNDLKKILVKCKQHPELMNVQMSEGTLEDALRNKMESHFDEIQDFIELLESI